MKARVNSQWILKSRPHGRIQKTDFEQRQVPIPKLKKDQVLLKSLIFSFDPTQRGWAAMDTYLPAVPIGDVMRAFALTQVVESKSRKYKVGDLVGGLVGWQEYMVLDANKKGVSKEFALIPSLIPPELAVAFVLTGATAYFGLTEIGKLKSKETLVVSGAAGATGSVAGQIGKIMGARVIGIAGGPEKCKWLLEQAHFDEVIDYKNENVEERIATLCPKGVDVFFDNVGGEIMDAVLVHLARGGRIVLCGMISEYDKMNAKSGRATETDNLYGVKGLGALLVARGKMQGFIVLDYMHRIAEPLILLNRWVKEGKLVQAIDMQEGFDQIPDTLVRIFEGKNLGKQLLKISDPTVPVKKDRLTEFVFKALGSFYSRKLAF